MYGYINMKGGSWRRFWSWILAVSLSSLSGRESLEKFSSFSLMSVGILAAFFFVYSGCLLGSTGAVSTRVWLVVVGGEAFSKMVHLC